MRIFGYCLGFAVFLMGVLLGGEMGLFIDYPSILITVGGALGFCYAVHSPAALNEALRVAAGRGEVTPEAFQRHDPVLETLGNTTLAAGIVGTLIGSVNMLANLDHPKSIGPASAVAILTELYAAIICGTIIMPLRGRLRRRLSEAVPDSKSPKAGLPGSSALMLVGLMWTVMAVSVL